MRDIKTSNLKNEVTNFTRPPKTTLKSKNMFFLKYFVCLSLSVSKFLIFGYKMRFVVLIIWGFTEYDVFAAVSLKTV